MRPNFLARRSICAAMLVASACAVQRPPEPVRAPPPVAPVPTAKPRPGLYSADEALRDVRSGALEYLGTGEWHSAERTRACAFRNQRVFVVNVYCTLSETEAFRLEIFSPERGVARIYAETNGPLSARGRPDYFTFMVENEPAPDAALGLARVNLAMSLPELRAYDERRYAAYLPACYAGTKFNEEKAGCLGPLQEHLRDWTASNRAFLASPGPDWYALIQEMRALAQRYGVEPK